MIADWPPQAGQALQIAAVYETPWQRYAENGCSIDIHGLLVNLDYLHFYFGA